MSWTWWRNKNKTAAEIENESVHIIAQQNQICADEHRQAWICWRCGITRYGVWPYEGEITTHSAEGVKDMRQWVPLCSHCVEDPSSLSDKLEGFQEGWPI